MAFIKSCNLNYSVNNIILYYSGFVFRLFWDRVWLFSTGWPQSPDPPASVSGVLRFQVCATTPGSHLQCSQYTSGLLFGLHSSSCHTSFLVEIFVPILEKRKPKMLSSLPWMPRWIRVLLQPRSISIWLWCSVFMLPYMDVCD